MELSRTVLVDDIVAVYLEDVAEPWMLGKVLKERYKITEGDSVYTWMGQMVVGDDVILVQKLEPTAGGLSSSTFMLTDKIFPCWVEDIRAVKIKLKASSNERRSARLQTSHPTNPMDVRQEISAGERERILVTLPLVMSAIESENVDKHQGKRAVAQYNNRCEDDCDSI